MSKMQHIIPHFLLDKYHPSYQELLSVQKLLTLELKILAQGHEVVHARKAQAHKNIVLKPT